MIPKYEWAKTKLNRVCNLLTKEELADKTGYRSVYGFDDVACSYFLEIGRVKDSRGFNVFADEILIDFDDALEDAEKFYHILLEMGISFDVYDSGGRSIHYHIPHQEIWSPNLPRSHKTWVQQFNLKADLSIYQHGRIFRLPGTIHEKTYRKKALLESIKTDKILNLDLVESPIIVNTTINDNEGIFALNSLLDRVCNKPPENGNRNNTFFILACTLADGGFSKMFCYELLVKINNELLEEPLPSSELEVLINNVYKTFY